MPKITQMGDISNTKMAETQNLCNVFVDLFTQTHSNIAQTICCSPLYPKTFEANKAHLILINYTNEFLSNIEVGLQCLYDINTVNKKATKSLNTLIAFQTGIINFQVKTIAVLKQSTPTTIVITQQKKQMSKDLPIFNEKGTLLE